MGDDAEDLVRGLDADVGEIVTLLRGLAADAVPGAVEEPDPSARLIGYTYRPGTYKHLVAAIAVHSGHVNLMFAKGADLADLDPGGLLEGTGKKARHVKFRTAADVHRPGLRELLVEAAARTPRP
ncbi:DUF1801 domain-containing protein [Nocardiopsis oceani]